MKEFIEKLIGRLEEELKLAEIDRERYLHGNSTQFNYGKAVGYGNAVSVAIEIVNQLAEEYNDGWIPCSERLPDKQGWYHITIEENGKYHVENDLYAIETADSFGHEHGFCKIKKHNIVAWCEYPAPYQPKGE